MMAGSKVSQQNSAQSITLYPAAISSPDKWHIRTRPSTWWKKTWLIRPEHLLSLLQWSSSDAHVRVGAFRGGQRSTRTHMNNVNAFRSCCDLNTIKTLKLSNLNENQCKRVFHYDALATWWASFKSLGVDFGSVLKWSETSGLLEGKKEKVI